MPGLMLVWAVICTMNGMYIKNKKKYINQFVQDIGNVIIRKYMKIENSSLTV
jgi:hypothetical protein